MMDDADRAAIEQERAEQRFEEQRAVRNQARRPSRICQSEDCEEELTEQRQEYGLCIDCARRLEARNNQRFALAGAR